MKAQNTKVVKTEDVVISNLPTLFVTSLPSLSEAEKGLKKTMKEGRFFWFYADASRAFVKAVNAQSLAVKARESKLKEDVDAANEAFSRLDSLTKAMWEFLSLSSGSYDIVKMSEIFLGKKHNLLLLESDRLEERRREKCEKDGKKYIPFQSDKWTEDRFIRCLKMATDKRPVKKS